MIRLKLVLTIASHLIALVIAALSLFLIFVHSAGITNF